MRGGAGGGSGKITFSSQVHTTGLCHLSAPSLPPEPFPLIVYRENAPAIERNLIRYSLKCPIVSPIYTRTTVARPGLKRCSFN
jgi:hypothetical protein